MTLTRWFGLLAATFAFRCGRNGFQYVEARH